MDATLPTVLPGDIRLMNATANVLMALGVAGLVAMAAVWLARQPIFALKGVLIEGDVARNSISTIRANAAPHLSGTFLTLDLATARRAFESVPWVREAQVRRVWPNRIAVKLVEYQPVALWGHDADKLVDRHGDVFEANIGDVEDDNLPTLDGPDGSAPHMLAMRALLAPVFEPLGGGRIDTLELSGRGSWHATLDNGAEIEIGRGTDDEVVARSRRFVGTLTQVTSHFQRPLESADLRHRDGYAVRLKGITTGGNDKPAKK
ncbi:MAG: cell division protein FtsQ/DivIB [Proteobacteria bacterium]|nr:cell division protein FtsQ/DivIB [Pseudomonadota bacterium]